MYGRCYSSLPFTKEQDPFPSPRLSEDPASPQTVNAPIQILIFCLRHYEKSLDTVIQIRTTSGSADRVSVFQNHAQTTSGCQLPWRRPSQCPSGVKPPPSFNLTPHCPYGSQLGVMMEYFALSIVLKLQTPFLGYTSNKTNEEPGRKKMNKRKGLQLSSIPGIQTQSIKEVEKSIWRHKHRVTQTQTHWLG